MTWIIFFSLIALFCLIGALVLSGPNLKQFDNQVGERFADHPDDDAESKKILGAIYDLRQEIIALKSLKGGFKAARHFADNLSEGLETDTVFTQVTASGVACEWAVAPNINPQRRILFMHGGAFLLGSPKGHRRFSDQLSKLANAAVLSVDYRMLPEHSRKAGIIDSQAAYNWLIDNGPNGAAPLEFLLVAGDSAGGNLALMLSSWSKHNAARKPDAVIGFSPSSDMTLASPTIKAHCSSDKILGEGLGAIIKLPSIIRAWAALIGLRMNPANPLASPVFGDLSDLPRTLIHASSNEMLLGDSIRYTNRAIAAGSDVTLQVWENQLHDWHLFNMGTGSANAAWSEIQKFIDSFSEPAKQTAERPVASKKAVNS